MQHVSELLFEFLVTYIDKEPIDEITMLSC